jgi:hypothetical protein
LAGLPKREHVFQPAEQAGQGREKQGVQRCHHTTPGLVAGGFGADRGGKAGDLRGQG